MPTNRPFRAVDEVSAGRVTRYWVRRYCFQVYPAVWAHRDLHLTPEVRAKAAWLAFGGRAVLAGWSAAALLGTKWIADSRSAVVNSQQHLKPVRELVVFRDALKSVDIWNTGDIRLTGPARTALDLARRSPLDEAVEVVDAIYQTGHLTRSELLTYISDRNGERGIRHVRTVVELSDEGAESPWETKTRLTLVREGFPKPQSQIKIYDSHGRLVARGDLGWAEWKVLVEYDGDHHFDPDQRNADIERWNKLEALGWRIIRVKAKQLFGGRQALVDQIWTVLRARRTGSQVRGSGERAHPDTRSAS